jgi:hypothetical protein
MRVVGLDIHRTFAEAALIEEGRVRRLGEGVGFAGKESWDAPCLNHRRKGLPVGAGALQGASR